MAPISLQLTPFISPLLHRRRNLSLRRPPIPSLSPPKLPRSLPVRSVHRNNEHPSPSHPRKSTGLDDFLSTAASLYPLYVTAGGIVACLKPSTFSWFVQRGPASYSFSLGLIMLAMGLTLELKDLFNLFMQRPLSILFGCVAQYTIMPASAALIGKFFGLSPSLLVGLILLGCCPGGTASNVVTLIAQGDVPLSIVMTVCTTLGAVIFTPFLTKILAGAYIPVDAAQLSLSTLQVVVAPILLGSCLQKAFPSLVKLVLPFAPLVAVLTSSLLACSVFSENVARFKSSMVIATLASDASLWTVLQSILSGELGVVILSVFCLHFAGFFVGYITAAIGGFRERERRAISIEVGMQNSSLGVILATSHFSSAMVALPPAMSAVIMNIMGSTLGFCWRYIEPSDEVKTSANAK
ncbi:probable sodium/metabolite cotransporter BASS1, chloroplastic [Benincasa hispida]|uniref:probable sodium/metabolite cotransporter BASS1, chloroplastic n=1 Tax=Benincasa hispida TaxID=102211 RepID=UPI001901622A|nr:probable sodium/metabolite cotransporter BASS1, chloroplastic [Benincasa hispida]